MNSEDFIDNTIANLKIIGMLQKNGKLCVRKGQLAIERDDHLQSVRRWIAKDSRDVTLMHVRNTINSALKISKGLAQKQINSDLREWTLTRIINEMRNCEAGLQNLKSTYVDDSMTVAAIDVLADRLRANCDDLEQNRVEETRS